MRVKFSTNCSTIFKATAFFLILLAAHQPVTAQSDTVSRQSKGQFLSKFEAYKTGKNIEGLQDIADHNHYPAPQKVLQWQKELQLNDRQKSSIGLINKELERKINEMNNFLITNERTMDSLFRYKKINNGTVIYYTNRYGLYQGELRNALLQACVKTEAILTPVQLKKYDKLLKD